MRLQERKCCSEPAENTAVREAETANRSADHLSEVNTTCECGSSIEGRQLTERTETKEVPMIVSYAHSLKVV